MSQRTDDISDSAVDLTDMSVVKQRGSPVCYVLLDDVYVKLMFAICTLQKEDSSDEFPEISLGVRKAPVCQFVSSVNFIL